MFRCFTVLILLVTIYSCNYNSTNNIDSIPADKLLNVSNMKLSDVLQYCILEVDSFDNDTIFKFSERDLASLNKSSTPQLEIFYSSKDYQLAFSYVFKNKSNYDLNFVRLKFNNEDKYSFLANDIHSQEFHSLVVLVRSSKENEILLKSVDSKNTYLRFGDSQEFDHMMTIRQRNIISLMMRFLALKKYNINYLINSY